MRMLDHPAYVTARRSLRAALDGAPPGSMIFLIGPSGVGKTQLRHAVMREVYGNPSSWGRGRLPITEAYATLPHLGFYSSRALALELLRQLNTPDLHWLSSDEVGARPARPIAIETQNAEAWDFARSRSASEDRCWESVMRTARARGCGTVSIEHATAMLATRQNKTPADHIQNLVSLAEGHQLRFLLTGVARVTELWDVHHDLRRRVLPIWFAPYNDRRRPGDRLSFLRLLRSLSNRLGYIDADVVGSMPDDLMAATAGICGEIIQLFERARLLAVGDGVEVVRRKDLEQAVYNEKDLLALWRQVDDFEDVFAAGDPLSHLHRIVTDVGRGRQTQ